MAATIPSVEPTRLRAGDTVKWKRHWSDYPTSTYTVVYSLRQKDGSGSIDITCTDSDGDHLATIARADSTGLAPGEYRWIARANDGTDYYTIGTGSLEVLPNLEDESADPRTWAEKRLEEVEAAIAVRAGQTHASHSIGGDSFTGKTDQELFDMRERLQREVNREKARERRSNGQKVRRQGRIRFGRAE